MPLSTEQVLLLTNLMYTYQDGGQQLVSPGKSVGEIVEYLDPGKYANDGIFMDSKDWSDIVRAVKSDPQLMRMTVAAAGNDSPGGGFNAVFTDSVTHEAVVAYKGTQGLDEWKDNFAGGNAADTPCQKGALDWYKNAYEECGLSDYSVTVAGHSKGGNKAKYVTLMGDNVDRCLSFDGQGFSDKFFQEHADAIAQKQHLIQNHNVDSDYVNFLLNDVGERHYYKGRNLGDGPESFLQNHCANSFFDVGKDGSVHMTPTEQDPMIANLDEALNGALRAMPDDASRDQLLEMFGDIMGQARCADGGIDMDAILSILHSPENLDNTAFLVGYLARYASEHPEFQSQLKQLLENMGYGEFNGYIDWGFKIFNLIKDLPDWAKDLSGSALLLYLKTFHGIEVPPEMEELLRAALKADVRLTNGKDRAVASALTDLHLRVDSNALLTAENSMDTLLHTLEEIAETVGNSKLSFTMGFIYNPKIGSRKREIETQIEQLRKLRATLSELRSQYTDTETFIRSMTT